MLVASAVFALPRPNAGSSAVLGDELQTGLLKGLNQGSIVQGGEACRLFTALKGPDGGFRNAMRAALALGMPAVARGLGRLRRLRSGLISRARHEARRGNVITAAVLAGLYLWAI